MNGFRSNEKYLSQIPALQLLINLGFAYITPEQALAERQGKAGYLGFTGTPLLKKEKNSFLKFGGLIEPHYCRCAALADSR